MIGRISKTNTALLALLICAISYNFYCLRKQKKINLNIEKRINLLEQAQKENESYPVLLPFSSMARHSPETVLTLYQMMKDVNDLFVKYNIPYWADGGTLLGAIRHRGMIPWDDDLDISTDRKHASQIESLRPDLAALGYELVDIWFGYKIFPANSKIMGVIPPGCKPWKYPFLDIFLTHEEEGKIVYSNSLTRQTFPAFMLLSELYPVKNYQFGEISISGPNNPVPFLNKLYGNDWNDITTSIWDHQYERLHEKRKILLTKQHKKPAEPLGPLMDRVK